MTLRLERNGQPLAQAALTEVQAATAEAVERLGDGHPVHEAVLLASASQARAGFDMMSGEIHAAWTAAAFTEAGMTRDVILDRLHGAHEAAAAAGTALTRPGPGATFWGKGLGGWGAGRGGHGAAATGRRSGGFILGADVAFGPVTAGVAGGHVTGCLDVDARHSRGLSQTTGGALYAGAQLGALSLAGGVSHAVTQASTRRVVILPGYSGMAAAAYGVRTFQAFGEAAYRLPMAGAGTFSPFVSLAGVRVNADGFTERGGAAALTGRGRSSAIGVLTVGTRVDAEIGGARLNGMIGWRRACGDLRPATLLAFRDDPAALPLAVRSVPLDRSALAVAAGVDWTIATGARIGVAYNGLYGARNADQQFRGQMELLF